jgi:hypothetical protein
MNHTISTPFSFLVFIIRKALSILLFIICFLAFIFIVATLVDPTLKGESKIYFSTFFLVVGILLFFIAKWLWNSSKLLKPIDSNEDRAIPIPNLMLSQRCLQLILLGCFLIWTSLLVMETLQVQHSCYPMIHWVGEFSSECRSKYKSQPVESQYATPTIPQPKNSYSSPVLGERVQPGNSSSSADIAGGLAGMTGAAGAAIAGAPVAVVVGVGIVLWFFIRSAMKLGG